MGGRIKTEIRAGSEAAGVEFTNGDQQPGVRLTKAATARAVGPPSSTASWKGGSKTGKPTKPK